MLTRLLQSEISEMPLLVLVYFQTDAIQQVEDVIRSVLAMQVPIGELNKESEKKKIEDYKKNTLT